MLIGMYILTKLAKIRSDYDGPFAIIPHETTPDKYMYKIML